MSLKNVAQRAKIHVLETCHTDINSCSRGPSTHVKSIIDRAYITFKGVTETDRKNLTYLTPIKRNKKHVALNDSALFVEIKHWKIAVRSPNDLSSSVAQTARKNSAALADPKNCAK